MAPGVATKVIAATCGLTAFVIGLLAGLFADNPAETILMRALVALVIGQVVGMIVGAIAERTVVESIEKYRTDHPIPSLKPSSPGASASGPAATPVVLSA